MYLNRLPVFKELYFSGAGKNNLILSTRIIADVKVNEQVVYQNGKMDENLISPKSKNSDFHVLKSGAEWMGIIKCEK